MNVTNPYSYLPLRSERVELTALESSDMPYLRSFFQDMTSLYYYIPTTARPINLLQLEKLLADWNDGLESFVFAVRQDGRLIGLVNIDGLDWANSHAEVGIAITNEDARGQGLAMEALQLLMRYAYCELGLHRLWARIIEDNAPSIKLFERLSFTREGTLNEHVYRHGQYRDMLIYGHLRQESSCQD